MTYPGEIQLYSYPSCTTCKKAISWLKDRNIAFELIHILENPPSRKNLYNALNQLVDRKLILNTRGVSYKTLGASYIKSLSDNDLLEILNKDGKLIKRPFLIIDQTKFLVGFNSLSWLEFFKNHNYL